MFYRRKELLNTGNYNPKPKIEILSDPEGSIDYVRFGIEKIGFFYLNEVPHCCGMLFLSNMYAYEFGKRHGDILISTMKQAAKLGGYSVVQCIISNDEDRVFSFENQMKFFKRHGFKVLNEQGTHNDRSGNRLYTLELEISL